MSRPFEPETRIPGATRQINPETLMPASGYRGRALWNMPAPIKEVAHRRWKRDEATGKRIAADPVMVPVYRGTSASYARWVRSQLRRQRRKAVLEKTDD